MGGSFSKSGRGKPWPTPNKLNDHIYELYKPTEGPSMQILFFHGLQFEDSSEAYWSTWTCGKAPKQIWPSTWLADHFPNAHIFSVSYHSSMRTTRKQGIFDLHIVAENLIETICSADIGQLDRPLILVGHCFGGLVMKNLCVEAYQSHSLGSRSRERTQNIGRFLDNIKGIFFYGTPHRGSHLLEGAAYSLGGPLMTYVKVFSKESSRLEQKFDALCKLYKMWHIASVGESLPMKSGPFIGRLVVPEASARYGEYSTAPETDHITLCRPASETSTSFQRLKSFLRSIEAKVRVNFHFHNRQPLPNPLVGLDIPVKEVEELMLKNQKVGIVGMGGIGKTTLAMAVFNKLGPTFEYTCFIHMVKKMDPEVDVQDVEKEVWDRHLHCRGKKVDKCKDFSWSTLTGKRLLLVWDDISSNRDLDVLSNIAKAIGGVKSRFIMTSRNEDLLNKKDHIIYSLQVLDNTHARQLFMSYACPEDSLESNVKDIVEKCEGLPLTLEILGSYLHGETNVNVWVQTLGDLDKANEISDQEKRLWAQLRVSYNDLEEEEQQMFLDVTTFFTGTTWTLREAKVAWRAIYGSEDKRWRILLKRSLVYKVDEDEPIKVHEQLQSLGRKIAASESMKCRIRKYTEAVELLQSTYESTDELENQEIHALRIESNEWQERGNRIHISGSGFRKLKTVRYLDVKVPVRVSIEGSQEIESLPVHDQVLLGCLDHQISRIFNPALLTHLVVLKISSPKQNGIECLHTSMSQLSALKVLKISDALELKSLPDMISRLAQLESLTLLRCPSFHTLPEDFGQLPNLKHLEFYDCHQQSLPKSFGELANLEHLEFCECEGLQALPDNFWHLRALKYLKFDSCYHMYTLRESFGRLPVLEHLELINCFSLTSLPYYFGHLSTLKHLKVHWLHKLESLPWSFGQLSALESLEFRRCDKLNDLPESLGQLAKLQDLVIDDCCNMERLPNSLADLKHLRHLTIAYVALESIPDSIKTLPWLQTLELGALPYLTEFPPWLGKTTLAIPDIFVRRIFHVQNRCFALAERQNIATYDDWRLSSWLDSQLGDPFPAELRSETSILILGKRGILKGANGDLLGALEDLNTAMENCVDIQVMEKRLRLEYMCRKERGYIRYLLDDMEGAREDGEAAFKHQSGMITDDIIREKNKDIPFMLHKIQAGLSDPTGFHSGRPILSYLNFEFSEDPQEYVDKVKLMWSSCAQARQRVRRSDFGGALTDLAAVDTSLIGYRAQAYILEERAALKRLTLDYGGALAVVESSIDLRVKLGDPLSEDGWIRILQFRGTIKRLTGDLHGALADLDAGMEKCAAFQGPEGKKYLKYICRKERGYVRYLLGDIEGARKDGEAAFKHQSRIITDQIISIRGGIFFSDLQIQFIIESGLSNLSAGFNSALDRSVLSYLNFEFSTDSQKYVDKLKLMWSSCAEAREKVRRSDFAGALTDLVAIDTRLLGFRAQGHILQERAILNSLRLDYGGALATMESSIALQVEVGDLSAATKTLRLRSQLKQLSGDLHGALEDLDAAMEKCADFSDGQILKHFFSMERGYVRYLLGDVEGAREDGEAALSFIDEVPCEVVYMSWSERLKIETMLRGLGLQVAALALEPVFSYLNFKFWRDSQKYVDEMDLMQSSHSKAMHKVRTKVRTEVRRSTFAEALADLTAVDTRLIGLRAQAFILQEKGILKRMMRDLDGALNDLTSAWQIISNHRFRGGDSAFTSGYECLKHRGYVKFLLGDLDGARDDAVVAVRKFFDRSSLGDLAGARGGAAAAVRDFHRNSLDGTRWSMAADESQVWEEDLHWCYSKLGSQKLKFLGFKMR